MATVVFADLVGSTGIFERLGDETASRFVTQLIGELSLQFEAHRGRVVKLLGDGLFVVFAAEGDALAACVSILKRMHEQPIRPHGAGAPVQMQMGMESGEVIEIDGDCFGDTVNSAARLADLAGASQILTTQNVWNALLSVQQAMLRSLGPMYLRGKAEVSHVYRVEWQVGRDEDATMIGRSMFAPAKHVHLELVVGAQSLRLEPKDPKLTIGRALDATLSMNDPRVSRVHATVEWRGGQFVLIDTSSYGIWVYFGDQSQAVVLRRTECYLVGRGQMTLGCERHKEQAPTIEFLVTA